MKRSLHKIRLENFKNSEWDFFPGKEYFSRVWGSNKQNKYFEVGFLKNINVTESSASV